MSETTSERENERARLTAEIAAISETLKRPYISGLDRLMLHGDRKDMRARLDELDRVAAAGAK